MKKRISKWAYVLPSLAILVIASMLPAKYMPSFIERYYSKGLYPFICRIQSELFGNLDYSVTDVVEISLVVILFIAIIRALFLRSRWKYVGVGIIQVFSLTIITLMLFGGYNHFRIPLQDRLGVVRMPINTEQQYFVLQRISSRTNILKKDLKIKFMSDSKVDSILEYTYHKKARPLDMAEDYGYSRPRFTLFSSIYTNLSIYNIYKPFFGEYEINSEVPDMLYPYFLSYGKAQYHGVLNKTEAHFLAWYLCSETENAYVSYYGYLGLMYYLYYSFHPNSPEFKIITETLDPEVMEDFKYIDSYWDRIGRSKNSFSLVPQQLRKNRKRLKEKEEEIMWAKGEVKTNNPVFNLLCDYMVQRQYLELP